MKQDRVLTVSRASGSRKGRVFYGFTSAVRFSDALRFDFFGAERFPIREMHAQ